ncbi:hypothetical protein RFI_01104 [Reticulomyxa filosa]|uniref:Uncharacterized protein n=1 Tax=Reticulomyxa filosa TaxID=46433 RepID=X6PCY9_RETFI|nr:hypothetical protein RFI_01104 [Reticulomyxa filosa]|eukprot:ETO35963.1 hypothetical protein RFI_01104 [Reticulomyxa filosa]
MKRNPFRYLFAESDLFLSNVGHKPSPDEHLKIHYCLNNHPFLIHAPEPQNVTCPWKDCNATITRTCTIKSSLKLKNTIHTKSIWFMLGRYYTSPKKMEPVNLTQLISILLRLLYHLLLLLRNEGVPRDGNKIQELLRQDNASKFLWKKIKQDFKRLEILTDLNEELLGIALHLWIKDFSEKFETWHPQGLPRGDLAEIYEFEKKLDEEYCKFFNSKAKFIELRNKSEIVSNNKFKELMDEIEETKEIHERYEIEHISQLFLKIQLWSWRDLVHHPLIAQLLNWDEAIWYIRYLPAIVNLVKHVHMEYSRQLLPDELHKIRISEILKQQYQCKIWWNYILRCWNYFALDCEKLKYNCQDLSIEHLCIVDSNSNNSQFNIYKIIQLLETQHNKFLKAFQQFKHLYIQKAEEEKQNVLEQDNWKCFFDIRKNDILCFNKKHLDDIIQQRSTPVLQYGQNDKFKCFDLVSIENDIYRAFVCDRQPLTFVIPLFEYRNDLDIHSCIATIETRHEVLKDAQFQSFWNKLNLSVASSLEKQKALGMLNDAIVYLYQNVNDLQVDMPLTKLLQNLQFEKDWVLFSQRGNNKAEQLYVKHVGVLWRQLNNIVQSEGLDESSIIPFVLEVYRQPLIDNLQTKIIEFVHKTSVGAMKDVLKAWREIAYKQGHIVRNIEDEDFAHMLKQYLPNNDLKYFPHQLLKWRYCAAAYECAYQEWKRSH